MKQLILSDFFKELQKEVYCIVKIDPEFPNYKSGSDIDLFCYNAESVSKSILLTGNPYLKEGYEVKVTNHEDRGQIYIDFIIADKIEFRFDLYNQLPFYRNVLIKPALFESIIENRVARKTANDSDNYVIYVPSLIDEMLIRYIEYHEWYGKRPDKIKHVEFILNKSILGENHLYFMQKLHHYTKLPKSLNDYEKQGLSFTRKLKNIYSKIKSKTLLELIYISFLVPIKIIKRFLANCFGKG